MNRNGSIKKKKKPASNQQQDGVVYLNRQESSGNNFNLYGLDSDNEDATGAAGSSHNHHQRAHQHITVNIDNDHDLDHQQNMTIPSPPAEFRNTNNNCSSHHQQQQQPHHYHSISPSSTVATTIIPAAPTPTPTHVTATNNNPLSARHNDKQKNWNSLNSSGQVNRVDDIDQVQSTAVCVRVRNDEEDETDECCGSTTTTTSCCRRSAVEIHARQCTSCPNLVPPEHPPLPPPSNNFLDADFSQLPHDFKLDHLTDINPRRLYPNAKFRARIHDVIDELGRFYLEVIYSRDDERKFAQIFKLFRLACKISPPPERSQLREGMRVGVLYKNDWHRAVVIDPRRVVVKFLDLGIERSVDAGTCMRVVDQKFFNVPLKALRCSLYVDEHINEVVLATAHVVVKNERLCLSREARNFFVRVIYKKSEFIWV